jgi:hypothetical protein
MMRKRDDTLRAGGIPDPYTEALDNLSGVSAA